MTLRELRRSMSLRLVDIAEQADLSTSYYCQIEKGHRSPNLKIVQDLAKAFNLDRMIIINAIYEQLDKNTHLNERVTRRRKKHD